MKSALLIRWKGGFADKTDPGVISTYGRREGFLSVASLDSVPSAESAGATALDLWGAPRGSVSASFEPADGTETPYLGVQPGDTITCPNMAGVPTTYRVEAFTVSEDANGNVTYTPELESLVETQKKRQQMWLSRIGQGTLSGRSSSATLLETVTPDVGGGRVETRDVSFSKGVLEVGVSPPLLRAKSSRLTMVQATILPGATSPALTFRILRNGSALSFATPGGAAATTFSLTPSAARLVLLPSAGDHVIAESDIVTIDLVSVAADASLFGLTATLADMF